MDRHKVIAVHLIARAIVVFLFCHGWASCVSDSMQVWLTTGDRNHLLEQRSSISSSGSGNGFRINVNTGRRYQSMKGFGAALTNSAAYVIHNSGQKEEILNTLFGSSSRSIGISYIRLPMGASDMQAEAPYSYDDTPWDFNLDHFSIDKDRKYIIPVLKRALQINPNLKIMATPWSAPAWLKTTNRLAGGQLKSDSGSLSALAKYFLKFIQAYQREGIHIDMITVQNEPLNSNDGYPTMEVSWQTESEFVKRYLGPTFRSNGINTGILIYDHNWDNTDYANNILNDRDTAQYVTGVAWHCYAGDKNAPTQVHNSHPDKDTYFSECSGGEWATSFSGNLKWNMDTLFISQPRAWAKTVLLFNLALDENHGPKVGVNGCGNCRGVLTVPSYGGFTREVEFYVIGHLSKFVKPGAFRIDSTEGSHYRTIAFQNPDASVAVIVLNSSSNSEDVTIQINNKYFTYRNFPGNAVATFLV